MPKTIDINQAKINHAAAAAAAAAAVVLPTARYCLRHVPSWGRADRRRPSLALTRRRGGPMAMAWLLLLLDCCYVLKAL